MCCDAIHASLVFLGQSISPSWGLLLTKSLPHVGCHKLDETTCQNPQRARPVLWPSRNLLRARDAREMEARRRWPEPREAGEGGRLRAGPGGGGARGGPCGRVWRDASSPASVEAYIIVQDHGKSVRFCMTQQPVFVSLVSLVVIPGGQSIVVFPAQFSTSNKKT